jgi:hypothetical protein
VVACGRPDRAPTKGRSYDGTDGRRINGLSRGPGGSPRDRAPNRPGCAGGPPRRSGGVGLRRERNITSVGLLAIGLEVVDDLVEYSRAHVPDDQSRPIDDHHVVREHDSTSGADHHRSDHDHLGSHHDHLGADHDDLGADHDHLGADHDHGRAGNDDHGGPDHNHGRAGHHLDHHAREGNPAGAGHTGRE